MCQAGCSSVVASLLLAYLWVRHIYLNKASKGCVEITHTIIIFSAHLPPHSRSHRPPCSLTPHSGGTEMLTSA
jgi:hypothetical protein